MGFTLVLRIKSKHALACSGGLTKSNLSLFRHSDRFDFVFFTEMH